MSGTKDPITFMGAPYVWMALNSIAKPDDYMHALIYDLPDLPRNLRTTKIFPPEQWTVAHHMLWRVNRPGPQTPGRETILRMAEDLAANDALRKYADDLVVIPLHLEAVAVAMAATAIGIEDRREICSMAEEAMRKKRPPP